MAAVLVLTALVYLRGYQRSRLLVPGETPSWRPYAFLGALLAVWAAVDSPLAACDHVLLWVHMVQHLLLSAVAAPLIWLAAPVLPLWFGMRGRLLREPLIALLRSGLVRRVGRGLGHPAVCWIVATTVFVGWHTPSMFQAALRSGPWRAVEHASFLGSGLLFWWPVVQPWPASARSPRWSMPLYLFLATLPCDALSAFLLFSDRIVYPAYLTAPRPAALSVLQDQEWVGAIMWCAVTIAYMIPAAFIAMDLLSPTASGSDSSTSAGPGWAID